MKPRRTSTTLTSIVSIGAVVFAGAVVSGCSESGSSDDEGAVSIVASTNVWAAVATAVGGDDVAVTSLIDSTSQDPHSYEPSARDILAVTKADVVIENGGGYDDFMQTLLGAAKTDPAVIDAVDASGVEATGGADVNEHVWYDLPTVQKVAAAVAEQLAAADPGEASTYDANAAAFNRQLDKLIAAEARANEDLVGVKVAVTEPVPLYMLDAVGAINVTPTAFSSAVEEGEEVSPSVLAETEDLFSDHVATALVYNEQTTGPITDRVMAAADAADVPVVPVTETLPEGATYLGWMRDNLARIVGALSTS